MALENICRSAIGPRKRSRSMSDMYSISKVSFSIDEMKDTIHDCQLSLSMPDMKDKIPQELSLSLSDMKDKITLELPMFEAERKDKIPPELPTVPTRQQPPRLAKRKLDLNVKSAKLKNLKAPKLHRTKREDLDQILTNLLLGRW